MKWQNKLKVVRDPISASVEEAVKLLKPIGVVMASMRCFQKTIGVITPKIGVYNYNTKRYALYRSDMVDSKSVTEFKEVISGHNVH